jgi:hypothetical protein
MKTPTMDRREHERFEVLGSLWGVLELPETAAIVNASSSGLLIEAHACPILNSVHNTDISIHGAAMRVDSIVRHLRPADSGKFLIGLEFVEPPPTIDSALGHLTPGRPTKGQSPDAS